MAGFLPDQTDPLRIAVLAGGESHERAVSLEGGAAVAAALEQQGHRVTRIDPADANAASISWNSFDVVFPVLHGQFGEDGTIQQILERANVPFVGSDSETSRLAFSKSASKERFLTSSVPTPPYVLIHESDEATRIEQVVRQIGYPLVVKPDTQGSSLGVTIVESPQELPAALTRSFHYDPFALMETAIEGTEWTVGLFDDRVLPPIQIEPAGPFYDYRAKYQDNATAYHFEFPLPTNAVKSIEEIGRRAAESLRTRGLARVDLRLDRQQQPWVLEVNTIPGMTEHSLIPKAAERIGMNLGELCEQVVRSSITTASRQRTATRTK